MHWLKCSLFVIILGAAYWQESGAQIELTNETIEHPTFNISKGNENKSIESAELKADSTIKTIRESTANSSSGLQEIKNTTGDLIPFNNTALSPEVQNNLKLGQKREVANITFNDIKPLLFFPILPFLFPPRENENQTFENNFISTKNEKLKSEGNPNEVKPFIFFDFAFIRRIPLKNASNNVNESKIINLKNFAITKSDNSKKNSLKNRRRRNTSLKLETPEFFDESPLFPDSELDEFLPKSDLFFPDLPFHHHKSLKKLSRRKRDQKKRDLKSDLKFFFDAFDEAFMRTKRELEQTDPILNFLKGSQSSFGEDKKDNIFDQIPNVQEKPRMKWRIQRNIKRLKNDHKDGLRKDQDGPMIIVDKVVKIGEFSLHDDGHVKDNLKKKKRETDSKKKLIRDGMTSFENDEIFPKSIFDLIKQEDNKRKKRNHIEKHTGQNYTTIKTTEIKIQPQMNSFEISIPSNSTTELKKGETKIHNHVNKTNENLNLGNLMKMVDTLKAKIKVKLGNDLEPTLEKLQRKDSNYYEKLNSKKASYENLKKNISELLNKFLELNKNSDNGKLSDKPEHNEQYETGIFDWTEKETLQNTNLIGKNSRERRQKKDTDFVDEYVDLSKKERQIADLNYLFLTVTLPTVFVFALALLACFFSLQVKGKLCSKLFRPRQVFIVEEDKPMQFETPPRPQTSLKVQTI